MSRGSIYLPTSIPSTSSESRSPTPKWTLAILALLATSAVLISWPLGATTILVHHFGPAKVSMSAVKGGSGCEQAEPRMPKGYNVSKILGEKERIIGLLSGAVQIPTEVFDEMGPVDEDPKWKIQGEFHQYLEKSFPLVHKTFKRTIANWASIYELPGTNLSLKPLFLTAHQDVVPVLPATLSQWDQPPYSGHYDGTYIWGRGASDTKGSLIAIMVAIEHLLETTDFKPERTIVLGFGSDEERGGQVGAPAIAKYITEKYGKDSISLLIDEGNGLSNKWGQQFAMPAVAEKGHYDLEIEVSTLGGHSSVPPPHTAIGYTSLLVAELEKNPHELILKENSPLYVRDTDTRCGHAKAPRSFMTCAATYAADMPKSLKSMVVKTQKGDKSALRNLPEEIIKTGVGPATTGRGQGNMMRAMMSTTQATDIINGGLKVNALPESVKTVINHRVNVASNAAELQAQTIHTLMPVVKACNLTLIDFSGKPAYHGNPDAKVILSNAFGYYTDPAPISPTDATDLDSAYTVMASTARGMWASRPEVSEDGEIVELGPGEDLVMAPFMSTGNTDTRRYWDLTRNIYRFRYNPMEGNSGAHTINEKTDADNVVEFARWYQAIILTMDQATNVA